MEIETQMAEDKEREALRVAKAASGQKPTVVRPMSSAVRRVATQGAVKRPLTPKVGRGF